MIELIKTSSFDRWLRQLRDIRAKARIEARIRRLSLGNTGDVKPVGDGISELRIDYGPGYRVYFMAKGPIIVVLLCVDILPHLRALRLRRGIPITG